MLLGTIQSINIAPQERAPVISVDEIRVVKGRGLEGDRYYAMKGTFSKQEAGREVTLIEIESIEALKREYNIELLPSESRRNIVTKGVALNHLVGCDFAVGNVILHGVKLCEPCTYLEGLTQEGIKRGLTHRGGLRADIVQDGVIRVGDAIKAL